MFFPFMPIHHQPMVPGEQHEPCCPISSKLSRMLKSPICFVMNDELNSAYSHTVKPTCLWKIGYIEALP